MIGNGYETSHLTSGFCISYAAYDNFYEQEKIRCEYFHFQSFNSILFVVLYLKKD